MIYVRYINTHSFIHSVVFQCFLKLFFLSGSVFAMHLWLPGHFDLLQVDRHQCQFNKCKYSEHRAVHVVIHFHPHSIEGYDGTHL